MNLKTNAPLAHELDVAWIIALWKAINGGDPAAKAMEAEITADETAALIAAGLASHLRQTTGATFGHERSFDQMKERFAAMNVQVSHEMREEASAKPGSEQSARGQLRICFTLASGQTVCVVIPRLLPQ